MTGSERDFDRIARAWLDLGPNEAPDRAVDAVLQAIETTPQVRRPFRWPTWRLTTMTRLPLLALMAGLLILAIGAVLMTGGGPAPGPSPTPTASASATADPSPSPATGPLPGDLIGGWVAPSRDAAAPDGTVQIVTFGAGGGRLETNSSPLVEGVPFTAAQVGEAVIRVTSTADEGPCDTGDEGTYDYEVRDEMWLVLTARDDTCTARPAILAGAWQRSIAHASAGGTGVAANFEPYLSITLPPGTYTGRGDDEPDTVVIDTATASYKVWKGLDGFADPCDIDQGRLTLLDMDALVAYLEGDPRFGVVRREEYEIDGHPAVELEFVLGPDLEPPCWQFDGNPSDLRGVLTWAPNGSTGFWNGLIGDRGALVVTEVDGATLAFEFVTVDGDTISVDRATLDTVRFLDALPTPPAG